MGGPAGLWTPGAALQEAACSLQPGSTARGPCPPNQPPANPLPAPPPAQVRASEDARPYGVLRLTVRREHVFEDSFHQLRSRTPTEMKFKLTVVFQVGCVLV